MKPTYPTKNADGNPLLVHLDRVQVAPFLYNTRHRHLIEPEHDIIYKLVCFEYNTSYLGTSSVSPKYLLWFLHIKIQSLGLILTLTV